MADLNFPRVRDTGTHPDSLRRLTVVEEEEQIRLVLDGSLEQIHRSWSSTFSFQSPDREIQDPLTYATLWSKELTLAALQAQQEIASLSKEEARKLLQQQESEYQKTLQIDVYWFSGPDGSPITGPGARVRLRDGAGNSYAPTDEEGGPLRSTTVAGGNTVLYRRNIFHFPRTVDGQDILEETRELNLRITPTGGPTIQFGWSWENR